MPFFSDIIISVCIRICSEAYLNLWKRGKEMPANIVVGTQWGDEGKGKNYRHSCFTC